MLEEKPFYIPLDNRDEKPYKNIILCGKTKAFFGRSDYAIIACTFPMMALGNRCGPQQEE